MKELLKIVGGLVTSERDWSRWARKMLSLIIIATLSINTWERYEDHIHTTSRELPVAALLRDLSLIHI